MEPGKILLLSIVFALLTLAGIIAFAKLTKTIGFAWMFILLIVLYIFIFSTVGNVINVLKLMFPHIFD